MTGLGRLYLRGGGAHGPIWWWAIGIGGKKLRFSTKLRGGTPDRPPREVELWRARKLAELGQTGASGLRAETVTVQDIVDMLLIRYEAEGRKSLYTVKSRIHYLTDELGGWKAIDLKADRVLQYAVKRRKAGAAVATVNLELALLARAYRIAIDSGRLVSAPKIPHLPGANIRRSHVPDAVLEQIRAKLPKHLAEVVTFLRLTGWRVNEALGLEWRRVDFAEQAIRLDTSKTGEPRVLSFRNYSDLKALLEARHSARGLSPWVFQTAAGGRISDKTLQGAWKRARRSSSLPGAMLHDLRRTMVRAMDRAGVPRSVAMSITGHKSEAVYRQYGLFDAQMQDTALEALSILGPDRKIATLQK